MSERGQTIILLILIMTVSLAIGLSIVQKSLIDVSTSTKLEQTSRAFSAAEAGIEKALNNDTDLQNPTFTGIGAQITNITDSGSLPPIPPPGDKQYALEFPPVSKEEVTQVWLADLDLVGTPFSGVPSNYYIQPTLDVYWGNSTTDKAALELTLIYWDNTNSKYATKKWYLDQPVPRDSSFKQATCGASGYPVTTGSVTNTYTCKVTLGSSPSDPYNQALPTTGAMLIRARLLYNNGSQPLAVQATGTCGKDCSLPPQARIITSTGVSGDTQRKIQVFQRFKEVPPYFDYAIFSIGEISK